MNDATQHSSPGRRLHAYRPVLDRLIFACSLLGVLVVVHLWVQQGRGFEGGCLGVADLSAPSSGAATTGGGAASGCGAVVNSEAGTFLGVSNIVLGFVFYLALTGIGLALSYAEGWWQRRLKQGRAVLVTGGFCYTLYLVYYQSFVLEQYCLLCMISAGLVTALFALHLIDFFTDPTASDMSSFTSSSARRSREVVMQSVAALLVFVLAGADVAYFGASDAPGSKQQARPVQATGANDGSSASSPSRVCQYAPDSEPVEDFDSLVQFTDPVKGNPNAPVTVIEYLDPTCSHCKTLHNKMSGVIEAKKKKARFVYKLFPLRRASFPPVLALEVAAREGKFFEMLNRQFATQEQGFTIKRLRKMARELGIDPNAMEQKMRDKSLMQSIMKERKRAVNMGVSSTPSVFINGRMVGQRSRTPACLKQLIDQAAASEQEG
jgi:protein-disulfide isomerase/uncharacterized membrane protein